MVETEGTKRFYRCDGKKCPADRAAPMCFYTADAAHVLPGFPFVEVCEGKPATEEDAEAIAKAKRECMELAEWQTMLPVEKRMECKKLLPVFEEATADAEVQP